MAGGSQAAVRVTLALVATALMPVPGARAALTRVRLGTSRAVGATAQAPLPPATRLRVTVALKPRSPATLAAYARAVSTPGSADYRHYLTPAQFARRFGADHVPGGLGPRFAPGPGAEARSGQPRRSLDLGGGHRRGAGASVPHLASESGAAGAPRGDRRRHGRRHRGPGRDRDPVDHRPEHGLLPAAAAGPRPTSGHSKPARPIPRRDRRSAALCRGQQAAAPSQSTYTADEIASAYGFSGLYKDGDRGAGVTVAVYELEPNEAADIAAYQSCYGTHATITNISVDGGTGSGVGSGEAALDIENLIGLAPDANVLVYRGPNSNSGDPGSGPYDTFSMIINQDRAQVISVSWGQCEAALGQPDAIAENTLFEQATVQGQSIIAASGDNGAEDCSNGGLPDSQPAVDDPSSQPFVTGVGGTSLRTLGPRPTESVWNSGGMVLSGEIQSGAGGGGVSNFWPMPAAQSNAAAALGVRNPAVGGAACGNTAGYCRQVPDVSADADPSTGYLIYWNGSQSAGGQPSGWQGIGGTSGAAPLWSALLALADASHACSTSAIGYASPSLYRAAGAGYAADFNDVATGNNDFTGTNGGRYAAGPGYDLATGLGTPNAAALAAALCAGSVRLRQSRRAADHRPHLGLAARAWQRHRGGGRQLQRRSAATRTQAQPGNGQDHRPAVPHRPLRRPRHRERRRGFGRCGNVHVDRRRRAEDLPAVADRDAAPGRSWRSP